MVVAVHHAVEFGQERRVGCGAATRARSGLAAGRGHIGSVGFVSVWGCAGADVGRAGVARWRGAGAWRPGRTATRVAVRPVRGQPGTGRAAAAEAMDSNGTRSQSGRLWAS
ncbi:hypothetical protein GCM10026982_25350 [Nocardiopsis aegyptia]